MKKLIFTTLVVMWTGIQLFAQDKPAYQIFNNKGEKVDYTTMLNDVAKGDIIFFGELHNNPISHWLELQVAKGLFAQKGKKLIMGAEMFEADNQLMLDEYQNGIIRAKDFEEEARLWPNYKTDYKPLLDFAVKNKIHFVATNIPRRYAAMVARGGFEALNKLSNEAKKYIAPLPINYDPNLPCYKNMLNMGGHLKGMMGPMKNQNLPKAQAIKDATMAYFILKNWEKGKTFYHFNGSYHSDNYQGIVWHIKLQNKQVSIKTISTLMQKDVSKLDKENQTKADYIIVVPEDMTTTY